jgi:putative transposase
MPRKARIDAPGALHHIVCRGIEKRKIFADDTDRDEFVRRLAAVVKETQTFCYAWALMPNHFHLLLRTGAAPITTVMPGRSTAGTGASGTSFTTATNPSSARRMPTCCS